MHTHMRARMLSMFAGLLVGAVSLGLAPAAYAAGIPVNTLADGSVAGACTLRDAIDAANTDSAVSGCPAGSGADTITFSVSGTIGLGSVLIIPAGSSVIVDGSGQTIAISGQHAVQVLSVLGTLDLRRVTIADGSTATIGGGIDNSGTLTVKDCTFSGNRSGFAGGAISNFGVLTVSNTTFAGNSAFFGGAIQNFSSALVSNSTFSFNRATGSAINNDNTATVLNSHLLRQHRRRPQECPCVGPWKYHSGQ